MKLAFITDSHFDQHSRFEECVRVHQWIADDARERGCSVTLLGGDMFESKSTAEERNAVADWIRRLAAFSNVVGVYGNHDYQSANGGDLDIFGGLATREGVSFISAPCVYGCYMDEIVGVACLPWPRRANLLAAAGAPTRDASNQVAREAMQTVLRQLGTQLREFGDRPKLFLGHVQTRGSRVSSGQELVGCDFELGLEDLSLVGADFYALGHIHLAQEWRIGDAPVVYGGSPHRCNFGETEDKSYTVIEFDGPRLVSWERVSTPCTPMLMTEATWVPGRSEFDWHPSQLGNGVFSEPFEARFRYRVEQAHREAARIDATLYTSLLRSYGAVSVKVEEQVIQTTRARAPEVGIARTTRDKLEAHWRSRGFEPGERRGALVGKLTELEDGDPG